MCEAFQITAAERPDDVALRTIADGISITWGEYSARVKRLAGGLAALGVGPGDTVGFMLTNRPEFHLLDTAAMHLGATPFSIYNTSSPEQIAYLLGDAANRVMIVEAAFMDSVAQVLDGGEGSVEHLIVLDGATSDSITLEELEAAQPPDGFDFEAGWRAVAPDDILTLIYTSGTTGPPKGVQLTHGNELAQCRGLDEVNHWPSGGGSIVVVLADGAHRRPRPDALRPDGMGRDAHVLPGGHPGVRACRRRPPNPVGRGPEGMGEAQGGAGGRDRRRPRRGASWRGARSDRAGNPGGSQPSRPERTSIADLLDAYGRAEEQVFAPMRAKLGLDRCASYVTGAAPAPLEVFEFFAAIGIPICEVWGMSELTSVATINPPERIRYGTVGPALPGLEIRLAEDGEVLARGPTVMAGYRNQPEKTAETIDADGWLRSGDIGVLDEHGYLKIVDRKKELIINAAGKNMSPANIEQQLKQGSSLIGQAIAIGDRRPYNVALIVLDPDACTAFAAAHSLADSSATAMAAEATVREEVSAGIDRANSHLSRVEQIKRFAILPLDWLPGGDELTPTMKLRRKPIHEKYAAEIESLYSR